MFRAEPWLGIGEIIEHADTSAEVIKLANLDWHVKQAPSYIEVDGVQIPTGYTINYKDDDNNSYRSLYVNPAPVSGNFLKFP